MSPDGNSRDSPSLPCSDNSQEMGEINPLACPVSESQFRTFSLISFCPEDARMNKDDICPQRAYDLEGEMQRDINYIGDRHVNDATPFLLC